MRHVLNVVNVSRYQMINCIISHQQKIRNAYRQTRGAVGQVLVMHFSFGTLGLVPPVLIAFSILAQKVVCFATGTQFPYKFIFTLYEPVALHMIWKSFIQSE